MKKKKSNINGITLIALIITIIVLLILSGVTIATLTGENGILSKASTAKEETKKAEYEEALKLIGNGLRADKIINNWDNKTYLEELEKEIKKSDLFENGVNTELKEDENSTKIVVTTNDGYVFWVTEDNVEYIGKLGEDVPPDLIVSDAPSPDGLEKGNISFSYEPSGWTENDVEVTISTVIDKYTLQYSIDGKIWNDYKTPITMKENGSIYTRLINKLGEEGGYATGKVSNIDREPPSGSISFNPNSVAVGGTVTATVTQTDSGSGVDIENCKWVFTTSAAAIGIEDISKYTGGGFTTETADKLTLSCPNVGTYYLHVLSVDKIGNKAEIISSGCSATYRYSIVSNSKLLVNWSNRISNFNNDNPTATGGGLGSGYAIGIRGKSSSPEWFPIIAWNVPVRSSRARLFFSGDTSDFNTGGPIKKKLFGAPVAPATCKSGDYTTFYGSYDVTGGAYYNNAFHAIPYNVNVELRNIGSSLYVGFQGYSFYSGIEMWIRELYVEFY